MVINSPETEIAAIAAAGSERTKNVVALNSGDAPRNKDKSDATDSPDIHEAGNGRSALRLNPPQNRY